MSTNYIGMSMNELRKVLNENQPDMPHWQKAYAELRIRQVIVYNRATIAIALFTAIAAATSVAEALGWLR